MATRPEVKVTVPRDAQLAVVYGAVMKGLSQADPQRLARVKIKDRAARKHYSTELSMPFNNAHHYAIQNKRYWDGFDGCNCVDMMQWFIKRVRPDNSITVRGRRH